MKIALYGADGDEVLFNAGKTGFVLVNARTLTASITEQQVTKDRFWGPPKGVNVDTLAEVAQAALECRSTAELDVSVVAAAQENRAYTIPKAVSREAREGLVASIDDTTARTPVSLRVARMLTKGGQVKLADVNLLARFFSMNSSVTAGATRWQLWGGDAGRRWTSSVVENLALTADGSPDANLLDFYSVSEDEDARAFWGLFAPDSTTHIISLFKPTPQGTWLSWDDGDWRETDDVLSTDERMVELDDDTAFYVASNLYDAPDTPISLRELDPEEWDICQEGMAGVDWDMVDRAHHPDVIRAAGIFQQPQPGDRQYTPEERSKNAQHQIRDANGKFATVGRAGTMKSGTRATIVKVNPVDNSLIVKDEQGNHYPVPAKDFTMDDPNEPQQHTPLTPPANGTTVPKLNLDGILGQPRAVGTTPKAMLPHVLQTMGPAQIRQVIEDYQTFIEEERKKRAVDFKGGTGWPVRAGAELSENELALDETRTPENSDVPPMYLALVDHDDPRAVMDLVALVPESSTSNSVTTFRRVGGAWVEDSAILQDLRSPTPPPTVKLDENTYKDVLAQVDTSSTENEQSGVADPAPVPAPAPTAAPVVSSVDPIRVWDETGRLCTLVAAGEGGLDRNQGNAERLRRYWLYGKGALKIRWGTPGDWRRAYRLLYKYMGPRAAGYVSILHKRATGMWPGDRRNRQEFSMTAGGEPVSTTSLVRTTYQILTASAEDARARSIKQRVYGMMDDISPFTDKITDIDDNRLGRPFRIPLVIPEGLESGDGRTFERGSLSMRTFPLPLMWQVKTGDGHDGSFLVGRVDRVQRTVDGLGNAYGFFDAGPYGQEAQRLVENGMLRWVSADLDRFEGEEEELAEEDGDTLKSRKIRVRKGRLMGITLVPKPAFQECTIELVPMEELQPVDDGLYEGDTVSDAEPIVAAAAIASRIPVEPPKVWFERPLLNGPTPITVTDEGQVFGHIATWTQSHIGRPDVVSAPRSRSGYAYFHTGVIRTADGDDVTVGQLTLSGGHAGPYDDVTAAIKHYDDTGSAIADVHVGEDSYGIWAAGAVRPGASAEQIRALRASAPSGDWRPVNGALELVAVCQVNVPGFPVARACVASGMVQSLVAAGSTELVSMSRDSLLATNSMEARVKRLERSEFMRDEQRRNFAVAKVNELRQERREKAEELGSIAASARERVFKVLDVDGYLSEFKAFTPERREQLAKEKKALKDGSFPIENAADLRRAIHAYGRAEDAKKASVRRHIVRRARALEKSDLIPKEWKESSVNDLALNADDARETLTAAALERRAADIRKKVQDDK